MTQVDALFNVTFNNTYTRSNMNNSIIIIITVRVSYQYY